MEPKKPPKVKNFGSGELYEVEYLCQVFGIGRRTALAYLRALHINPMYIGKEIYFSLPTFKRIMYVLSRPGSPGFLFPSSAGKLNAHKQNNPNYISEVTPSILEQAADPKILAEMAAIDGKDPRLLNKLLTNRPGRPTKEKPDGE